MQGVKMNDFRDPDFTTTLRRREAGNRASVAENESEYGYIYPILEDEDFNLKIARKKEFGDNKYEERTPEEFDNIKEISQTLCDNTEFELAPHQMFVRNFISSQTPYNGLLLFHGVGTGKTCTAISVCEEMRTYTTRICTSKKIIIVASPAVQANFKIQLFDKRKLKERNGLWDIKACTGNKFLKEVNPMNVKGLSKNKVVGYIERVISNSYIFKGYIEFSNYISSIMNKSVLSTDTPEVELDKQRRALKKKFSDRMLVIDEVHNLRTTDDGVVKNSSSNIINLVTYAENLKILILSATPMFNDYSEIIWILNILNLNDKRFPIKYNDVFDAKDNFILAEDGEEIGKDLLIQKMLGYISYVRGNDPFTFPYTIYPFEADNPNSYIKMIGDDTWTYPETQVNGTDITSPIKILDLTITDIGEYQQLGYDFVISSLKKHYKALDDKTKGLSYTVLDAPLQSLNMIYPHIDMGKSDDTDLYTSLYGGKGLSRTMTFDNRSHTNYNYNPETLKHFGRIFSPDKIGRYSSKIKYICKSILKSEGIVFIYSQYISGGAIPIALALEEMGITRYGTHPSLFENPPPDAPAIDAITKEPRVEGQDFNPATYIMITGNKNLTPNVAKEMSAITDPSNINGEKVKVVIVSRAGSEGLDFQNIRQTHILDPWYNLNRQDQIIGRAVRNFSHCKLPFEKRNVSIFLYGTRLRKRVKEDVDAKEGDAKEGEDTDAKEGDAKEGDAKESEDADAKESEDADAKESEDADAKEGEDADAKESDAKEGEDTYEVESIDMYIYRLAEEKAKRIAIVTRILKENSVDCLLNRVGQNFSLDKVNKIVDQTISTGEVIDFQIGDKDGSKACDFTDCEYKCKYKSNSGIQDIGEQDLTTYGERFIIMNLDKIIQRIRLLFRESYIYDTPSLVSAIRQIKNYPIDQIYTALDFLVSEKSEQIVDVLGRLGNLVNVGKFYMFIPAEINTNGAITRYQREAPIAYKRKSIVFNNIPTAIAEPSEHHGIGDDTKGNETKGDETKGNETKGNETKGNETSVLSKSSVYKTVRLQLELLQNPDFIPKIHKREWSRTAAWAIYNLNLYNNIENDVLLELAMDHIIDVLPYKSKVELLNFIENKTNSIEDGEIELIDILITKHFKKHMLDLPNWKGIVITDLSKPIRSDVDYACTTLTLTDGIWVDNHKQLNRSQRSEQFRKFQLFDIGSINEMFGLMGSSNSQNVQFKIKDGRVASGASCEGGVEKDILVARINKIVLGKHKFEPKYEIKGVTIKQINALTGNEIKQKGSQDGKNKNKHIKITSYQLCIESELLVRYYDSIKQDDMRWFFNSVETAINKLA